MATQLTLPAGYAIRFARDGSWRPEPLPGMPHDETEDRVDGSTEGEARPVLRSAATMAAIGLCGFTVVCVALLTLLRVS